MICMEIYGNGVKISGMIIIMVLHLMGVHGKVEATLNGLFGVAAGTFSLRAVLQRVALAAIPIHAPIPTASAS